MRNTYEDFYARKSDNTRLYDAVYYIVLCTHMSQKLFEHLVVIIDAASAIIRGGRVGAHLAVVESNSHERLLTALHRGVCKLTNKVSTF